MALGAATLTYNFMNPGTLPTGISLTRAGTATYFDSGGVLRTAPLNLWLQSADASNAAWTKGAGGGATAPVVTANQTTAPDGTMTAASAVFPAVSVAASWSNLNQNIPFATGSIVTFSMYLKGAVGGEQTYLAWNGGVAGTGARLTLTTAWHHAGRQFHRTVLSDRHRSADWNASRDRRADCVSVGRSGRGRRHRVGLHSDDQCRQRRPALGL
jgi:hypothetical protein